MAKLGLVFIAVFCAVQLTLGARLVREAPAEATTPGLFDSLGEDFGKFAKTVQGELQKTFTQENFDKLASKVSEGAKTLNEQLQAGGKQVGDQIATLAGEAQKKISELTKEEKKN